MTDPERISKRSTGLAAQLLQAGADEQPSAAGVQQTLAALGVSGAVLTTTGTASAAAAGTVKATSAASAGGAGFGATAAGGTVKAVSATLLVKWIGIGVVGGVGLAGAAAVATRPTSPPRVERVLAPPAPVVTAVAPPPVASSQPVAIVEPSVPEVVASTPVAPPRVSAAEPAASAPMLEVGAPLAAEVAYVDRARALLASGQSEPGLAMLRSYEREFPEARLLPEILFLRFETCDRLGRSSEARNAAQRLLDGFPRSPHAARARQVLAK